MPRSLSIRSNSNRDGSISFNGLSFAALAKLTARSCTPTAVAARDHVLLTQWRVWVIRTGIGIHQQLLARLSWPLLYRRSWHVSTLRAVKAVGDIVRARPNIHRRRRRRPENVAALAIRASDLAFRQPLEASTVMAGRIRNARDDPHLSGLERQEIRTHRRDLGLQLVAAANLARSRRAVERRCSCGSSRDRRVVVARAVLRIRPDARRVDWRVARQAFTQDGVDATRRRAPRSRADHVDHLAAILAKA